MDISIVQTQLYWESIEKNLFSIDSKINAIKNTDLILLPEMFNTSFSPKSVHLAEGMNGRTVSWMTEIAHKKKCAIAGSLLIEDEKKYYNRLIWVSKNGDIFYYDKRHLFSLAKENEVISKGKERLIVEINGSKICPLICYDLRFPVFSRNDINYDILIYLANWPIKRIDAWDTLLKARAIENQCYTIGVNRVGDDGNGNAFNGHSQVLDAFGKALLPLNQNKDAILQIYISIDELRIKRQKINFLKDRDRFNLQ